MRSLTGGAGADGVQGLGRLLWCFFSALLSQRAAWRWCQLDASGAKRPPRLARRRTSPPAFGAAAVRCAFFVRVDETKRWISSAMRGRSVIWKKLRSHTNKTITMFCFAFTFYVWYKPVHIKTVHFVPLWNPVLAPPTQPSYSVRHVSAPIWTKGMHVGEDFPRWDDSQEASRMFIPSQESHGFTSERFKRKKFRD